MTFTVQAKAAVVRVVYSKLSSHGHNIHVGAAPHKNRALTGSYKYGAVSAVIDVQIGSDIENEVLTIMAVIDIVLLFLD